MQYFDILEQEGNAVQKFRKDLKAQGIVTAFIDLIQSSDAECLKALESLKSWFLSVDRPSSQKEIVHREFSGLSKVIDQLKRLQPSTPFESLSGAYKAKNYERLLELVELKDISSLNIEELEMASDAAYASKNANQVMKYCRELIYRNPSHSRALILMGALYFQQESFEKSAQCFRKLLEKQPQNQIARDYLQKMRRDFSSSKPSVVKRSSSRARRRWRRKPVNHSMMCNSFDSLFAQDVRVRSLSAGGCLIQADSPPKEFNFSLMLQNKQPVRGYARLIYQKDQKHWGVKFEHLSPREEDLINLHLAV